MQGNMSPSYWGKLSVLLTMVDAAGSPMQPSLPWAVRVVAGSLTAFSPRACRKVRWKQVCVHQLPQCPPPQHVLSLLPYLGQSC